MGGLIGGRAYNQDFIVCHMDEKLYIMQCMKDKSMFLQKRVELEQRAET